jgi:autotransporter-associated beta strand protein
MEQNMKNIPHRKTSSMKQIVLSALLLAAPLAATAQFAIFTDDFTHGSTTNHTSNPAGTPFASSTSYDIASTKNASTAPSIANGEFKIQLNASTSSGIIEAQALFTKNPITLVNVGDSITLQYTFRMTNALPGTSAYIGQGLYSSQGGTPPVPGNLANAGLGVAGSFVAGDAQPWQGLYSRIVSGATASSTASYRPPQTGTSSANQSLIGAGVTGGFASPGPTTLPGSTNAGILTIADGSYYTIVYTISMADTNTPTLTLTNSLYQGTDTTAAPLMVMTNIATGATFVNSFDGLAFGRRDTSSLLITMVITNITISANLSTEPGQPFDVTGGGEGCVGGTFPVGLNGSVTTNDYYLYTNGVWNGIVQTGTGSALNFPAETVISVPLTNTVFGSNTVSGATGFMFGSVVVGPNPPPAITNQPVPVTVATGSIAVFSVGATGGGLTYQWYKNGAALTDSSHISGSTTPTLVISSVVAGDAANTAQGYYAIITSGCGATLATATNSLTISAPANIVWAGPDTNWDLTTPNFTSGGNPVVFHNGDNVTFDDSSAVPTVTINNHFIAPSLITESASQSYNFSGPGVIQGPGALVMNGPGILSINNSNAFTGGATINGGTLILSNQYALGPTTVTLAGGTLEMPFAFSSAAGLSNNINVTGNSTLQFDRTGTFATVLDGAITGSPSATLTILNNSGTTATSRMRLYGAFTNNANVVLSSLGSEIEFAPYLPSGDQIYNGVISGSFGHIVPRGGGNIILNNTNTFNDQFGSFNGLNGYSLFMSSGNAGFGADSISTTPGIIDASPAGTGKIGINVGSESGTDTLFANGGAHTIGNKLAFTSTTNTVTLVLGGSNNLTFSGEFDLADPALGDTVGTNRTLQVTNTAATAFSGVITDNGIASGITKTGTGMLFLDGANTYTGLTTISNGVLAGSGSIAGPVDVETPGAIGGGSATAIGVLTVNNSLTVNGGVYIRVNKTLSPSRSNDLVSVTGTLSSGGAGTVTVTNIGATAVAVGDKFTIFSKPVTGAGTLTVTGGGMNWNNNLAVDGSITAASVATTTATNPTNMTFSVSGGNLTIAWPADHLGWYLQMNTNGLSSNTWVDVASSNTGTNAVIPINPSQRTVLFRMSLQP